MEILIALLMALVAVAYPVYVDIRHHGRDNILRRSAQDVLDWQPLATAREAVDRQYRLIARMLNRALRRFIDATVKILIALVVLSLIVWLVRHFL